MDNAGYEEVVQIGYELSNLVELRAEFPKNIVIYASEDLSEGDKVCAYEN